MRARFVCGVEGPKEVDESVVCVCGGGELSRVSVILSGSGDGKIGIESTDCNV